MKKLILAIIFCFLCVTQVKANDSNEGFSIVFNDSHWGMSISDVKKMMRGYELIKEKEDQYYGLKYYSLDYKSNNSYETHSTSIITFCFRDKQLVQAYLTYDTLNGYIEFCNKVYPSIIKYYDKLPPHPSRDYVEVDIDTNTCSFFLIRDDKPLLAFEDKKHMNFCTELVNQWEPFESFIDGYKNPKSEHGVMYRMLIETIKSQENYLEHGNWKQKRDAKHNMELCEEFEKIWKETVMNCEKARDKGDQETCLELIKKFNTKLENIVHSLRKIN